MTMHGWIPLGAGEATRDQIAERAGFIRGLGRGHREPLSFTLAGGNTRTGRVQAIETDGVRVGDELLAWTTIVDVRLVTYHVRRFHRDEQHPDHQKVIATGLTLTQAQTHCQREDTHERDADGVVWFDGYDREAGE